MGAPVVGGRGPCRQGPAMGLAPLNFLMRLSAEAGRESDSAGLLQSLRRHLRVFPIATEPRCQGSCSPRPSRF